MNVIVEFILSVHKYSLVLLRKLVIILQSLFHLQNLRLLVILLLLRGSINVSSEILVNKRNKTHTEIYCDPAASFCSCFGDETCVHACIQGRCRSPKVDPLKVYFQAISGGFCCRVSIDNAGDTYKGLCGSKVRQPLRNNSLLATN